MEPQFQDIIPTVLIVDDNPNNIKIIALALRSLKYKIVIATNGNDAIKMVEQTNPDLVLLDIMMPEIDGFETCRLIKANGENKNLPIIFITALNDKVNLVKGFEVGGVDYITKPFSKDELISRVKTHLELKQTRDKLQQTTNYLENLNSLKDKMFSVIGHDLRSPLGSVKMTLELLSQSSESFSADFKSTIDLMLKTTDEVFNLLENLLGWAKSQSGNLTIHPEELNLNEVINSVFYLNKGNINLKQLHFETAIENDISIFADLNTIKIVFRNIISNAIKFTPQMGSIKITSEKHDDKIQIAINDSGVGIPSENIVKLFNPTQHHTTYGTNNEPGSGLGLILCHNFVLKNNGKIWVKSEQGKGTTFFLELPTVAP